MTRNKSAPKEPDSTRKRSAERAGNHDNSLGVSNPRLFFQKRRSVMLFQSKRKNFFPLESGEQVYALLGERLNIRA